MQLLRFFCALLKPPVCKITNCKLQQTSHIATKRYQLTSHSILGISCYSVFGRIELHVTLFVFNSQQQRTFSPEEAARFEGEFHTDDVPTIRKISINYRDGKLQFSVGEYHFHLNHIAGLTFELIDRRKVKCLRIVVMGINHEKVHFDPSGRNTTSPGFTVFGFNLQGKAYFYRKRNMLS